MELYLMQHGACFSKEIDPAQPLSPVGAEQIEKSARAAARLGISFEAIISSDKERARQTARIMAKGTGYPEKAVLTTDLVKPMSLPLKAMEYLKKFESRRSVLLCSHLPFLQNLISALITDGETARIKVDNGGLACLEAPEIKPNAATLRYYLTPLHLKIIAGS